MLTFCIGSGSLLLGKQGGISTHYTVATLVIFNIPLEMVNGELVHLRFQVFGNLSEVLIKTIAIMKTQKQPRHPWGLYYKVFTDFLIFRKS